MAENSTPTLDLDYTKPPAQLLVDIINLDNGTSLKKDQLTFGLPEPITGKYNTKLKATAVKGKGLNGSTVIRYNRIDIGQVPKGKPTLFTLTTERFMADVIPAIDAAYKLKLTPDDYVNSPIPSFNTGPGENVPVDLVAGEKSLVFISKLSLSMERPGLQLSNIITNVVLRGLTYVAPTDPLLLF